ncbi:MAG TPA: hypothetical protein VGJ27_12790 [Gaiellaceae bacterium]
MVGLYPPRPLALTRRSARFVEQLLGAIRADDPVAGTAGGIEWRP